MLAESVTDAPFLRFEYLRDWWQTLGGGEWPQAELVVVTAHEADHLVGVAPLFQAINREGLPALLLLGSIEISDYLDLIVRPADLPRFVSGLLDFLASLPFDFAQDKSDSWRALDWYNLPEASPTLPALETESASRGWTFTREIYQPAPYISLPTDFDTYLAGIDKKQRHEIKRKMRRAAEHAVPVRWYLVEDESTLDAEMDGFFALMTQDPAKEKFLTEPMRRQMLATARTALRGGWLWLAFLEVGGQESRGRVQLRLRQSSVGLQFGSQPRVH